MAIEVKTKTTIIETRLDNLSNEIDQKLKEKNINFEELQKQIYQVIMLLMRRAAKTDQEYLSELNVQIKAQAVQVQGTYNTWPGMTITVISAGVSLFGGFAGLAPLLPSSMISQSVAQTLAQSSQSIGTASTGLSGVGSIFNSRSEATRGVMQINLKRTQDKEEDRKGTKHSNNESRKTAKTAMDEFLRMHHDSMKAMMGG